MALGRAGRHVWAFGAGAEARGAANGGTNAGLATTVAGQTHASAGEMSDFAGSMSDVAGCTNGVAVKMHGPALQATAFKQGLWLKDSEKEEKRKTRKRRCEATFHAEFFGAATGS